MDPVTIATLAFKGITEAIEVYNKVKALKAQRAAGVQIQQSDLDELFAMPALDYDATINAVVDKNEGQ